MSDPKVFAARLKELATLLDQCEQVRRLDAEGEKEAWRMAHGLLDIEEALTKFQTGLSSLSAAKSEEEISDALLDIGLELQHIVCHVKDMKIFEFALAQLEPGLEETGEKD